jgi:hypothetical protein
MMEIVAIFFGLAIIGLSINEYLNLKNGGIFE